MSRTDDQLAMLDDSATYYGWLIDPAGLANYPYRQYAKGRRLISYSCHTKGGVAALRIRTWGEKYLVIKTDLVGEIMAELASNTPPKAPR